MSRNRKSFIREEGIRSARLIVIAAEGRCTENIYFEALAELHNSRNVHIKILRRQDNNSAPGYVLEQLKLFEKDYSLSDDDELWVVVDKDGWSESTLSRVAQECSQHTLMKFCLSNPCFELWLLLHLIDVSLLSKKEKAELQANRKPPKGESLMKKKLRAALGSYRESQYDTDLLLPYLKEAIVRARKLDINPGDRWPQTLGTRVYLVAESIILNQNNKI